MMKHTSLKKFIIALAIFLVLCTVIAWQFPSGSAKAPESWISIIPPLMAVTFALVLRNLYISFLVAILCGGFLTTVPAQPLSGLAWLQGGLHGMHFIVSSLLDSTNIQIMVFVILVMSMISVLMQAGGLQGIIDKLERFARSKKSAQFVTVLMGLAIFIDDYANTMIVGSSMRPVTDRFRISREKFAFLVDATSAPIAGIAVISTWIGYEVSLFSQVGTSLHIQMDGYAMFFDALSYRFYCFMMIIFVLINVLSGQDYGPMRRAERNTLKGNQHDTPQLRPQDTLLSEQSKPDPKTRIRASTALLPLGGLFLFLLSGLWIDGGGNALWAQGFLVILNPSAWREVMSKGENNILILALAAGFGLVLAMVCARFLAKLAFSDIIKSVWVGCQRCMVPLSILVLAWSLKAACDSLHTGQFLAQAVGNVVSPLWFPALLFIVAGLTSFATGTSWGTMAILIPTAIPIAFNLDGDIYGLVTMMSLGAVLDGAIFGDHCSPISDTTIMSSIFSSCDHINHVKTQLPYSVTVALLAVLCGYLPAAWGLSSWFCLGLAGGLIGLLYLSLSTIRSQKNKSAG
ncbi:Na+/H+ antiporter NhaC family protein [candidate division CSSED10-310 bacterium]|uniref:Na+/H+ antiporter NhaC family protein n=1 Tax=candidate division CSSED10-310 bacterium TaxID=2855610 RepID=A0ABV6Z3G5_UNCC1